MTSTTAYDSVDLYALKVQQGSTAGLGAILRNETALSIASAEVSELTAPVSDGVYSAAKRLVDVIGAVVGLILFAPVCLVVALLIACDSAGPIIYRRRVMSCQDYTGGAPESFDAYKFRTMIPTADAVLENSPALRSLYEQEFKLRDDPRLTRFGARLRRASLDEVPQLINVLRGQMSLVGPRMISPPELAKYGENAARLLSVKPGLTGLWQVSGRNDVSYKERIRLDMWYVENRSVRVDLEILLRTAGSVLSRRGAI